MVLDGDFLSCACRGNVNKCGVGKRCWCKSVCQTGRD